MTELWISKRDDPANDGTYTTVCSSCLVQFLAGRIEVPIDGLGDEYFDIDDLINARRVAIRPACAFNCEAYPEDMHRIASVQRTPCNGCSCAGIVNHKERLLYAAENAISLAATGEGRDHSQAPWRLANLPWWFDYFVVFVSVVALYPTLSTAVAAHDWSHDQLDILRDAVKRRHSQPAMAADLEAIGRRALDLLPGRFQADPWRGMDN